jgi:hypothetical protein
VFKRNLQLLSVCVLAATGVLVACSDAPAARNEDPAIAAIYADADARAAQARAQQLKAAATEAANATATAQFEPFAAQTRQVQSTLEVSLRQTEEAAPLATATMAAAQTATSAPLATATAVAAQTATAAPAATEQARQVSVAQTAVVAPTATWEAFKLEEAKRDSALKARQQDAAVNRLIDILWIGAVILLVVLGVVVLGWQISRRMMQATTTRAAAATQVEQARADAERERQRAEEAKAKAALARPPVYVIEEKADLSVHQPTSVSAGQFGATEHGDIDVAMIWESQIKISNGDLEQTGSIVIDNPVKRRIEE